MITEKTILCLPDKVEKKNSYLIDRAVDMKTKLNVSADILLSLVDGKRCIKEIAEIAATKNGWDIKEVKEDTLALCLNLNSEGLLNLQNVIWINIKYLMLKIYLLIISPYQYKLLTLCKRYDFANDKYLRSFSTLALVIYKDFRYIWFPLAAIAFIGAVFGGPRFAYLSLVVVTTLFGGFLLHEFFHFWTFLNLNRGKPQCYIAVQGIGFSLRRKVLQPDEELLISLLGPLVPSLLGVSLIFIALSLQSLELLVGGLLLFSHCFSIIPLSGDGKIIYKSLRNLLQNKKLINIRQVNSREAR